ncbi:N-6 DNA methylase [Ruegeria atlantica]|uniref:N-6 DNA methylase n=1 Tax=Ruegeria atlantica TaxID=81569 RepID=UPI002494BBD3|nr:N-6 DNA methylase [Ruegeria atlantica]
MTADLSKALEAIERCRALRDASSNEAVLRSAFESYLRAIFGAAEDQGWINHYGEGAEAHTKIGGKDGGASSRFVDNLIGSTSLEYEADLRTKAKFDDGYRQVREYTSASIRDGADVSQVRGILSDTVEWRIYDVALKHGADPPNCTPEDVELVEIESFEALPDELTAQRFVNFIRRHLAREQSRPLLAENLALDLGLESKAHRDKVPTLQKLVENARAADPSVELATDLWSRFVDHLEGAGGAFRPAPYLDEVYLLILARLLSANALAGKAISNDETELKAILDGSYFFAQYQLENLVEQDYFGWLVRPEHIDGVLPIAQSIQSDLYVYDFTRRAEDDLFGRLMAQLARRSQRKLLGQEWTPSWLANHLAERCLDALPEGEMPAIVDMCCGSGAILAEVLRSAKSRYRLTSIHELENVVTGFDIDPLAVALAKTTWVIALSDELNGASAPVTIPIFHADSLFAITPVSASIPLLGETDNITIELDGSSISLPAILVQPEHRELFDRIVDWAYDEARDTGGNNPEIADARSVIDAAGTSLSNDILSAIADATLALALRMKELVDANRNGIWAFILRNTYRPGLLAGQFNGLVSNPPWLAMSALADNPYRGLLASRAELYGVNPAGSSFLHLELGITHLIHAVDRYLQPGAAIACLVPGTILNGNQHQRLRSQGYLRSRRAVPLLIEEIWQVAPNTFKYPGAAIIGKRAPSVSNASAPITRGAVAKPDEIEAADFSVKSLGSHRTAWVLEKGGLPAAASSSVEVSKQGADLMPRTAVCVEILENTGTEYRVTTPSAGTPWAFTVKQPKKLKNEKFPGYVSPDYLFEIAQSENLLPFIFGPHRAPIAIPAHKQSDGTWLIQDHSEIRRSGHRQTALRFKQINDKLEAIGESNDLQTRIDVRFKLTNQNLGDEGYLVLSGAGGTYICAACLPVSEGPKLVIDQTLYWQVVIDPDDAWFRTGMLNSSALTEAILPFNPEGDFGPRHIHTLPYRVMPPFDASNANHIAIAEQARAVAAKAQEIFTSNEYISDPEKSLSVRRRKLRQKLSEESTMVELERLCAVALGVEVDTAS